MNIYDSLTNSDLNDKEIRLFNAIYKYPRYTLLSGGDHYTQEDVNNLNAGKTIQEVTKYINSIFMISVLLQQTYDPNNIFYTPFMSDYPDDTLFKEEMPNKNVRIIIAYAKKVCNQSTIPELKLSGGGGIKKFTKKRNNKKYKLSKHKNINKLKTRSFHKTNNNNNNNNKNNKKTKHKN